MFEERRYGRILCLGQDEGYNIFTFTNSKTKENTFINAPSKEFLKMIISGIKQSFNRSDLDKEILNNFKNLDGVRGNFTEEELIHIIKG